MHHFVRILLDIMQRSVTQIQHNSKYNKIGDLIEKTVNTVLHRIQYYKSKSTQK